MAWQPITLQQLSTIVQQSLSQVPEEFEKIKVPFYQIRCKRCSGSENEKIFVVAKSETKLLIFDDVEDEFAIADMPVNSNEILIDWVLCGTLEHALLKMNQKEIFGASNRAQPSQ